jgi:hypothetical protein
MSDDELAPPPFSSGGSRGGTDRADPEDSSDEGSGDASGSSGQADGLEDPQRLRELQESLSP